MRIYTIIMSALLILPSLSMAEDEPSLLEDEPSLLIEGSYWSLIALRDNFTIEYSDQVSDGCLPQPSKMKDKMELVLRQNGFSIATEEPVFPNRILITALGFATSASSCVVHLDTDLVFWGNVAVPFAQTVPSGPTTFALIPYPMGNIILTGSKNGMQERVEKQVQEFGESLYLEISRAKDFIKKKFPQILEYKAQQQAQNK